MAILNGNYREYKLDNRMRVALQETPSNFIVGKIRVNFGRFHEKTDERGYAHLLEHCLASAGSDKHTPLQVEEISNGLGYFNAYTSIGRTTFPMESLTEDLEPWLDLVSGFLFNPRFDNERVKKEKGIVLREIADSRSNSYYEHSKNLIDIITRG